MFFSPRLVLAAIAVSLLSLTTAHGQRQMERLGRGVTVLRSSSTQTYIGWRLLGNDPEDIAFNLYRSANGGTAVKVNSAPITATTNYVDTPANLAATAYTYSIRTVLNGTEVTDSWANTGGRSFTLPTNASVRQYLPVTLQPTPDDAAAGVSFGVKFCWVGDFDGDGEYDFLVNRDNPNIEARQWLQAYKRDGTLLWQMNMGPNSVNHYNITPGSSAVGIGHGDNATVYDLDGDGRAEVIVRTANGVVFPNASTLTAPNDEVQYISIIDGLTGLEKARATVPIPTGWVTRTHVQGQMGIAYADGVRPSLLFHASNRNPDESFNKYVTAWDYRNGALSLRWTWLPTGHTAEGHQIRIADVNNDGKDELVDIGHVVKADGSGQINGDKLTEVVHGDRFHVTDIDPDRPGLETFLIQQNNPTGLTTMYHASDKSSLIRKWYAGQVTDVGRGTVGAFVPELRGLQFFSTVGGTFNSKGVEIYPASPFPPETIWWDENLSREFLSTIGSGSTSPGIDRFNTANPGSTSRVLTIYTDPAAPNSPYNNYIADGGRPQFWGDILGDWREELVCVATDNSELRIYTTKTPDVAKSGGGLPVRIYTLMHNPQYRVQATTKGYVQSSYTDYYLGYGMTPPQPPPMVDAKLVWKGGNGTSTWDAGATAAWTANGTAATFANGDTVRFDLSGNNTTAVTLTGTLQPGELTVYNAVDYTFAGSGTLAGPMKLVKAGAGSLVLPNAHPFTGKTTVWDGALVVNGDLQGSAVTVWGGTWGGAAAAGKTGGRLAGTGRFSQPVTIKSRGAITPGAGMQAAGTLTFGNGLTAEDGSTFALDLSDDPAGSVRPSDRIAVTGNLALSGSVKIVINPLNSSLAAGTYTLATYSGTLTGGLANLSVVVPAGTPYTLSAGNGTIQLAITATRPAAAVTWRGTGATWDLATSQNWLNSGSPDVFVAGDAVTFDATGAGNATVSLATVLPTAGVTVSGTTNYTLGGAGSIDGAGGLTKSGTGTLTLATVNTYSGPTVVNGGVLAVSSLADAGEPSSIGASSANAGNLILNGGTLRLASSQTNTNRNLTLGGSATIDIPSAGSSIQLSGSMTGSGTLVKSGSGTLLLAAANTHTGGTVIQGGTIYLAGATANSGGLGSGSLTIQNGTLSMADVQASETAAWNLIVPVGATARLEADGRCSLTGSLTGSGELTYFTPYVRSDLRGNWSAFTGRIFATGVSGGADFRISNTFGYANAAVDLGANVYAYYAPSMGANLTLGLGELSGAATASLRGGPTASRTLTWQVGARNTDSTYAGAIQNGTGPTALAKIGSGALTLTGASTHTGATTVSAGKLVLSGGSLTGSAVTVASGAAFGGRGAVTGNVTFQSGSTLLANPAGGPLAVTGNVTLGGPLTIAAAPGTTLAAGTYPLLSYTGTLSGTPALTWAGAGFSATFNTATAGQISITLVTSGRPPADLTWTGGLSAVWDSATANWSWSGGATPFQVDDRVRFDGGPTAVQLSGTLAPASVVVGSSQNFTFSGSGVISGNTTLSKSGSGSLTLASAHTFTGGTTVTGGTLVLGNAGATGSGSITLNGGTLDTAALAPANPLAVAGSSKIIGGNAGGTQGVKDITGNGTLTLETASVFDLEGAMAGFSGTVTLTGSGSFRLFGAGGSAAADWDLGSRGLSARSGAAIALGSLTGSSDAWLSNNGSNNASPVTFTIGANGRDTTFAGTVADGGSKITALSKTGPGTLTLAGSNSYTGATQILGGTLRITGTTAGTTALTIAADSVLEIAGSLTVNGPLTNNGTLRLYDTPALSATGAFVNNGTLDLINSSTSLPANLQNNGTILRASDVRVLATTVQAGKVTLRVRCYPGHRYQLQSAASLDNAPWTLVPDSTFVPIATTDHEFVDPAPAGSRRFYRVIITP